MGKASFEGVLESLKTNFLIMIQKANKFFILFLIYIYTYPDIYIRIFMPCDESLMVQQVISGNLYYNYRAFASMHVHMVGGLQSVSQTVRS